MLEWTMNTTTPPDLTYPVVVDLETQDPNQEESEIERMFAAVGNLKDQDKIEKKKAELKLATTDSAPIWCVGIKTPQLFISISLAILSEEERKALSMLGWELYTPKNEKDLLSIYAAVLASLPRKSRFIAAGDFDLHKSRFRYAKLALDIPPELFTFKYSDLMRVWQGFTNRQDKQYTAVKEMALKLGIDYDLNMDGGEIPKSIEDGNHFDVLMKNYKDCVIEEQIAYRLLKNKLTFQC